MPTFIETQFPITRLSAESYKERKAGASQTLTGLGKWWGRKPLILVRASILGMLMPASSDAKKDREIFLKILTMDDEGTWQRCKGEIPAATWRQAASPEVQEEFIGARGLKQGLSDEEKETLFTQIWDALSLEQQQALDAQRMRPIPDRAEFEALTYAERLVHCERPENVEGPSGAAWGEINAHLATTATCLSELIEQLGQRTFGHTPRVGDSFCGGGSIPFEAARIGCEAFGSDLNPVDGLLTWASLNLLGGGAPVQDEVRRVQEQVFAAADQQITEWGIEHNDRDERAEAFLYCVEVKPEGCDYYIPLAPSWVITEKYRMVVTWKRVSDSDRLTPEVLEVSTDELKKYKDKKGATVVDGRVVDPFDANRSWTIEALRGADGLRRWTNDDLMPRPDDVFQERLYCIRWAKTAMRDGRPKLVRRYAVPDAADLAREAQVLALLRERFPDWQREGFIPSKAIPEGGDKTEEPIRTRGWTHWHQLFTPRQLLMLGQVWLEFARRGSDSVTIATGCLSIGATINRLSKLCGVDPHFSKGPGSTNPPCQNDLLHLADPTLVAAAAAVETPVYRREQGLWPHQKYFARLALERHRLGGARQVLADQVGLGKTVQLAMAAMLMALDDPNGGPILVLAPKPLLQQWQDELMEFLSLPSARWNGKAWVDENDLEYPSDGAKSLSKCPRRIGLVSQGLVVRGLSEAVRQLLSRRYTCFIVDEAHRARRRKVPKVDADADEVNERAEPNKLMAFLREIGPKTKSVLLATATPVQLHPVEAWDLLHILSHGNDGVLGGWTHSSPWFQASRCLDIATGDAEVPTADVSNGWEYVRDPLPSKFENTAFERIRRSLNASDTHWQFTPESLNQLSPVIRRVQLQNGLLPEYGVNFNPLLRCIVRRMRAYLEATINPATGGYFLPKVTVKLFGESNEGALVLGSYLRDAYAEAEAFSRLLQQRVKGAGFFKTLLLRRMGSSMEAGRRTVAKLLGEEPGALDDEDEDARRAALSPRAHAGLCRSAPVCPLPAGRRADAACPRLQRGRV